MAAGRRWTIRDRSSHTIYLTQERWDHITAPTTHPELNHIRAIIVDNLERILEVWHDHCGE